MGTLQKDLQCNSMQLLFYQAPLSSLLLLLSLPWLEDLPALARFLASPAYSPACQRASLLSALLAFAVNLSSFLIIGTMSPLT